MKKFWIYIGIGESNRFEKYQGRRHGAMTYEEAKSDAIKYGYKFRDDFEPEEFKNLTKDNVIIYPMNKVPSWLINNITLRNGYGIFDFSQEAFDVLTSTKRLMYPRDVIPSWMINKISNAHDYGDIFS